MATSRRVPERRPPSPRSRRSDTALARPLRARLRRIDRTKGKEGGSVSACRTSGHDSLAAPPLMIPCAPSLYSIGRFGGAIRNTSKQLPHIATDLDRVTGNFTLGSPIGIALSQMPHTRASADGPGLTPLFT